MECTFATLAAGLTFTQAKHFSAEMNESYTSETSFYKMQKKLDPVVQEYGKESMQAARTQSMLQSNNEIYVSGDGRYPVKKYSSYCSYDIIDCKTNKILALGSVDKQSYYHPQESFNQTSNLLESEAMRRAIEQLRECKNQIIGFTIDGDNKNKKILQNADFLPKILRDPNHLAVCFKKYLSKELAKYQKMVPNVSDCFRCLREK